MRLQDLGMRTKIVLSLCVPLFLAAIIGIVSIVNINAIMETGISVNHTHRVMRDALMIINAAVDMETGMSGDSAVDREEFSEPYRKGGKNIFEKLDFLQEMVRDNHRQVKKLDKASSVLKSWQKNLTKPDIEFKKSIGNAETKTIDDMGDSVKKAKGKNYFDKFRLIMLDFVGEEEELMVKRQAKNQTIVVNTKRMVSVCMILGLGLGILLVFFITTDIQEQVGGEPARIAEIARNVANGNLDIIFDNKELTGIHAALADMVMVLKKIVSDVKGIVKSVSTGKIDARGDSDFYRGGWHELVSGINNALETLAGYIDQIPSPFMIIDTSFHILSINKTCSAWVGKSREEILGQKCYEMFRTSDCNTINCACARAVQSGVREKGEAKAQPLGKEFYIAYNGVPVKDQSGKIVAVFEFFEDQTLVKREDWIKSGQNELNRSMSGELDPKVLTLNVLNFLARYIDAQVGVFYMSDKEQNLRLVSSYGCRVSDDDIFLKPGEGMIGQAALEQKSIFFCDLPKDHVSLDIDFGMGKSKPKSIFLLPLIFQNEVLGVMGLAASRVFDDKEREMLDRVAESISVNLNSASARVRLNELLEKTRVQSEELQSQQEELKTANEELEQQAEALKSSKDRLQMQQEELKASNEALIEKNRLLEKQKKEVAKSNARLESSREDIRKKAGELELATRYKTEFLANMSHELRTPLNSLLLLSKNLTKNKDRNLSEKQIHDAKIIYKSGNELLELINGILDLSRIESGKIILSGDKVSYIDIADNITNMFRQIFEEKKLDFSVQIDKRLSPSFYTDQQKLEQIIKNLISNAIKFTEKGRVVLGFNKADEGIRLKLSGLDLKKAVAISVSDTGKGIHKTKHKEIFEAFQQADGSIMRKYGGTGLGLSICKKLAGILGGEIHLESTEGKGSVFTVYVAENLRELPGKRESTVLVNGGAGKKEAGMKRLLVVEDNHEVADNLKKAFEVMDVRIEIAMSGKDAFRMIKETEYDCMILDLMLPDISGFDLLKKIDTSERSSCPAIIIYTAKELNEEESFDLYKYANSMVTKSPRSIERLVDEVALFLNTGVGKLPGYVKTRMAKPNDDTRIFNGKKIMIVDDDVRNIYSIISSLEDFGIEFVKAKDGEKAIETLCRHSDIDLILMDIMMPVMDGYEAMKRIRKMPEYKQLPILALTAKGMKRDRELSFEAGATDYLMKPVDPDKLVSTISGCLRK